MKPKFLAWMFIFLLLGFNKDLIVETITQFMDNQGLSQSSYEVTGIIDRKEMVSTASTRVNPTIFIGDNSFILSTEEYDRFALGDKVYITYKDNIVLSIVEVE